MSAETPKGKICFVCTANLCRSPFAEYYLRARFSKEGHLGYEVVSAGTNATHGYSSAPSFIELAKEFEVDMARHLSQPLTRDLLDDCRFILVMESSHFESIKQRFPDVVDRTYLLRNFSKHGSRTRGINDPAGLNDDFVRSCYDDIAEAVDGFADSLIDKTIK